MNRFNTSQPMPYLFELALASSNCRNRQELDQIVSTMRKKRRTQEKKNTKTKINNESK
jgi:hypothetical protein